MLCTFGSRVGKGSEEKRRGAGNYVPRDSVFRRVLFKQAAVRSYADHFADDRRVLKLAVRQPYFHDAEILFGGNGDAVHHRQRRLVGRNAVAHQHIRELAPAIRHVLVADLVRETTAIPVSNILPYRRDALPHQKQHAVHDQFWRQHLGHTDRLFHRVEIIQLDVTLQRPIGVMRQMAPQRPTTGKRMVLLWLWLLLL